MAATNIELLAAILSVSRRESIKALLTTIYPVLSIENNPITGVVAVQDIRDLTLIFDVPMIGGSVSIGSITQQDVITSLTSKELEVIGTVSVGSITQTEVLIEIDELENKIEGSVSIGAITQVDVVVTNTEVEAEVKGTVSIGSITQG
jgi:hypothetical protein